MQVLKKLWNICHENYARFELGKLLPRKQNTEICQRQRTVINKHVAVLVFAMS